MATDTPQKLKSEISEKELKVSVEQTKNKNKILDEMGKDMEISLSSNDFDKNYFKKAEKEIDYYETHPRGVVKEEQKTEEKPKSKEKTKWEKFKENFRKILLCN